MSETRERTEAWIGASNSGSKTSPGVSGTGVFGVDAPLEAAAAAAAPAAAAAVTLRVPLVVLANLETSFLFAAGPKVLETRERTEAATGSSSADAGGVSDAEVVGTPAKGAATAAAAAGVVGVDGAAAAADVSVELALATPARLAREARDPNLEIRSVRALSMAALAAVEEEEEEEDSGGRGGSAEGKEGGGEGEVEVERPGIEVKIEDHEKLTVGVTRSESTGAQ